ncbi:hypothetical protein DYB28_001021 [Aphanomyces astaci]|uniref:Uncharacterized protein n=1 Tax=Aphanomyces astaci TaxID=112090 RepID=A0A9X8H5B7_APHAT|nr:hypothetical protein DYB28_001021 [Aphanomyces astaci]
MMAHKQHPNLPLHVTIAEDTTNQDEYSLDPTASSISQLKHSAAPVVIKKKPSATGMRYRNPLPPNYRPSPTAISTPIANNATPPPSLNPKSPSMSRNNSAMSLGEPSVAAAKDKDNKYMPFTASYTSVVAPDAKQAQLQRMTSKRKVKKATDLRGMLPTHSDPASMRDPELKLFHEASMERQCITALAILIPEDKSSSECAKHLPIAGSKLLENPLLATKLKLMKGLDGSGKKRKTKKGAKKGGKKSKKKKAK